MSGILKLASQQHASEVTETKTAETRPVWFTVQDILDARSPLLPSSASALQRYIAKNDLRANPKLARRTGKQRGGWEYHIHAWPNDVQHRLRAKEEINAEALRKQADRAQSPLWRRYDRLNAKQKKACAERLAVVNDCLTMWRSGVEKSVAAAMVSFKADISVSTYFNWERRTHGVEQEDWLAAMAPEYAGRTKQADIDPRAWSFLKADYLRDERPSFASCHRRMMLVAGEEGWQPIPAKKTLQRRIEAEVPAASRLLARHGRDAVKGIYPAQKRDRTHMHAMQAVNSDGHKFDVFVTMPDGSTHSRIIMVAMQDLYSGKILSHRIGVSEHKHLVRLTIGDMLKVHGIPGRCYLDNGRAFASKDITGGTRTRFRFKVRDEEPDGLLTLMGVETTFVTPYSGQSKPIERAFRDMCDDIAKTPEFAGAWTGNHIDNKPANYAQVSIPFETAKAIIAREITLHNARLDRTSDVCKGRSFDQAFADSLASQLVKPARPSAVQERFWLLAAEEIRTKDNGMVHLMGNRYWTEALADHGKRKVVVRFDPQNLLEPVHVYDEKGRHICEAPNFGIAKFDDVDAARDHNSKRKAFIKASKAKLDAERQMSIGEVANLYSNAANKAAAAIEGKPAPAPQAPTGPRDNVRRLATNAARKPDPSRTAEVAVWDEDADIAFGNALAHHARFQPGHTADLIPIPKPQKDTGE